MKKSIKILVIRNAPIIGGAELYYIRLADAFKKYHINCKLILLTNNKSFARKARLHNIRAHIVDTFGKEIGTKHDLLWLILNLTDYLWKYLSIIQIITSKAKVNLVVFSGKTEKIILTPFIRLFNIPVVWLEHGRVFTPTMAEEVLFLYKFVSRFANRILAEANDTDVNLLKHGINRNKIQYLGSGVDTDYFIPKINNRKKGFVVGFMATVCWEKGIREYLKVATEVSKKNRSIKFLVVGDGPQLTFAKNYVQKKKLAKRVTFVGYQDKPKKYLQRMNVLLSPIHHPGAISLAVAEAMSIGVVPIVTNIGGNRELVLSGITGYIFPELNMQKTPKIILTLLKDRKLLKQLSLATRKHIKGHFTVKQLANKWYSIVKHLRYEISR